MVTIMDVKEYISRPKPQTMKVYVAPKRRIYMVPKTQPELLSDFCIRLVPEVH